MRGRAKRRAAIPGFSKGGENSISKRHNLTRPPRGGKD
jgi:hypothetical protein